MKTIYKTIDATLYYTIIIIIMDSCIVYVSVFVLHISTLRFSQRDTVTITLKI
jgi:hypothetical protein